MELMFYLLASVGLVACVACAAWRKRRISVDDDYEMDGNMRTKIDHGDL